MIERRSGNLHYFQFNIMEGADIFHGIFTRKGGVSPGPWSSLNLGGTVGDDPLNVKENLTRLLDVSGYREDQLVQVRQVHSAKVIQAETPVDAVEAGDAIITNRSGLLLLMRFADCVPIMFFDPEHRAIAIAHAGWKGTLKGVAAEVVKKMSSLYGTSPAQLQAGIGPSIGPDHYLVGSDVIAEVKNVFPDEYGQVLIETPDGVKLDLWKSNEIHLRQMGVEQIEISGICTGCETSNWYSHRAEKGKTGRFAGVIGLK